MGFDVLLFYNPHFQIITRTIKNFSDLERVREGLGDKLSMMIQLVAAFIAGFIVGFIYNWRMTLVGSSFLILVASFSMLFFL